MNYKIITLLFALMASVGTSFAESGTCGDNLTWNLTDGVLTISGTGAMTDYNSSSTTPWYSYRSSILSVIIEDGVTNIGKYALGNCGNFSTVIIPNSVTSIGEYAFYNCSSLSSVTIPENVASVGNGAFNSTGLKSVVWNAKNCKFMIVYSTQGPFTGSNNITSFTFGDEVQTIPECLCLGMPITSITIPANVTKIGSYALNECKNLTTVVWNARNCADFSKSPFYSFDQNPKVTSIVFGEEVKHIPAYLCSNMGKLSSVTIPSSVTSIGSNAFSNCTSLSSVTIPSSVTSIGKEAFNGCNNLTSVNISDLAAWCAMSFGSANANPLYYVHNLYINGTLLTDLNIPNGVTSIGNYVFYNCTSLSSVTIPSSVTSIGNSAFFGCSNLISVTINDSFTSVGTSIFSGCNNMHKILWNVPNAKIAASIIPMTLDSLIIGEHVEEIEFESRPTYHFVFLNPLTRVRMYAAPKASSFYDYNHDGTMEFADTVSYKVSSKNYYNVLFKNLYGFSVSDNLLDAVTDRTYYDNLQTINLNNDTLMDFISGSTLFQANSTGGYDKIELDYLKSKNSLDHLFALDADLNGTTDFYSCEEGVHYFHLRQFDGSYLKVKLNIISEQAEVDSAIYAAWDKPKTGMAAIIIVEDHFPALKENMFISNVTATDDFKTIDTAIDLDKNGLVDLLSSTTGVVLYNMGNNTFLRGKFRGAVTVKDMNNDGVEDFVIYNESTKTVSLQIYDASGSYNTITLMQNMDISNVWCYDFDNDGDVDILLPFDWNSTSGYAYLVFFRNDGNNTFKKVESAFDDPVKHFQFLDCRDVDNDGKYEIIARDSISKLSYWTNSSIPYNIQFKVGDYYLIRYNNRLKANMDATPFVANTLSNNTVDYDEIPFVYGDFDNDGNNECYYYGKYTYKTSSGSRAVFASGFSRFANTRLNTPPSKMSAPLVSGDAETGKLLISWEQGNDIETSNIDLVYSLRIGSTPGLGDMWYASALSDGKQIALNAANVGSHLSQIINISGWKEGDYYIAVQAIDPNGLGGAWSDEVVYHHSLPSPSFNTNIVEGTTADTIFVQYAGMVDNTATYIWNFGDCAVVLEADETKQAYKIVYNTAGTKTISLQVEMADGRTSDTYSAEIKIYPMKLEKDINYYPGINYMSYFDMDMDGQMDALGYYSLNGTAVQGFFKGKADGSFIKLAKTYNSDLTVNDYQSLLDSCIFADFNMDGLPDVQWSTNKGTTMYNMEDFDVEFSDETFTLPYTEQTYDFNGDGIDDEVKIKNTYALAIILNGPHKDTIELDLPSGYTLMADKSWGMRNPHIFDIDNNGYLDFVVIPYSNTPPYIIYLNEDWSFYCQDIPQEDISRINKYLLGYPFVDLNSDGTPDFRSGYFMKSRITNEVPAVPTNLRAVQNNDGVYLYWDAAKDKETPAAHMRYNISVKKKGVAVGTDNAFIVSPMNGLYDEANIVPGYHYPHGTSYFIPIDKLTGGQTYEFQIQSIDLWNAHSPMSAVYTFTVQPQVLITMPAQTCINTPVTVAYTGTNNGGISWNFNGGVSTLNTDGTYSVYWSQDGLKTVTATLNGNNTASRVIYVQNAQKDLSFTLPERVLNNSWTQITLPANYENLDNLAIRTSSNCTGYILPKKNSRIFQVCFNSTSADDSEIGWVEFYQNDAVCGEVNNFRDSTLILAMGSAPAISLVMVDAATGKNMITWDAPANLPTYVDSIVVYKEEGATNNWVMQAKVSVANGQWIDNASDPSVKSNKYCIAYTSIYGGESPKSTAHKTPHLQTNYGLNGAINLYWTYYQGDVVNSYQILRGTSTSNLQILTTVAGDECTYTDNNPIENAYYAISYSNADFVNEWVCGNTAANAPSKARNLRMRVTRSGHSNIMLSSASVQATLAQSLNILSMERVYTLSPSRTTLHLYAEVTPSGATFKQVKWSIVSGQNFASINSNGLLVVNNEGLNGTLRVRATTIDGSSIYAERDITVTGFKKTLSLFVNNNEMGKVSGAGQYSEGEIVDIQAYANYGYHFVQWSDGNTNNPRSIVFMHDTTFTAEFARNTYTIVATTHTEAYGSVTGGASALYKEQLTLVATPAECYHFVQWNDGNTDNPRTVTVTEDKQYTAQFAKSTYSITKIAKDNLGSINGPSSAECQQEVTLTAQPIEGYRFVQWSDGNKENPRTVVITRDTTFQAEFVARTFYTLSLTTPSYQGGWGTETGAGEYESGTTVTITAVPNYGYHFAQWSDGNTDNPRTIVITQDTTFQAEFAKDFYTLSLNTLDWQEGWGTETGAGEYEYGSTVTIKAVSNYGYHFMRWDDGNTDNPRTVTVTQNKTYTAVFARNIYSISVLWDPERGTVSYPSQEEYLRTVNISASPNTGYRFVKWNDGDKHSARSFVITQDTTFTAEFEPIKYTITFKNEDGSIIDQIECDYGTMPTHSDPTKPANGIYTYTFAGWQPALAPVTGNATYTASFVEHEEISGECEDIHETWLTTGQANWGDMRCYTDGWRYSQIYGATIKGKLEDGLDTPARNLTGMYSVTLTFKHLCSNVSSQNLTLWVCPDFKDTEDDEWYELTIPNYSGSNGAYVTTVINVPLSYVGKNTVFGFSYDGSSSQNSSYWYIRDLQLDAICANSISYYTIRFLNMDSTVLQTMQVKEGDMPTYTGAMPTRAENEYYTFTFKGWKPEIVVATATADYIAQYDSVAIPYYTIRFLNWDGTVLQTESLKQGTMPVYKGATPTRPDDEYNTYLFKAWSPTIVATIADVDYTAQFTATEIPIGGCTDIHFTWLATGANDMGEITTNNAEVWTWDSRYGAAGSKSGGVTAWLLTPAKDLSGMENVTLSFSHVHRYAATFENEMTLWVCADYQTSVETSSWQQLTISPYASNTNWTYVDVIVEVPENKVGERTVFGFKYMSTQTNYAKWQIKDLHLDAQCAETPTGVENVADQAKEKVRKILINNVIYILRGEKAYTLTGQEVR